MSGTNTSPADLSDKAIKLAQTTNDIRVYQELIDLLETQIGYYKKKLRDAQDIMQVQHEDFLQATGVSTTTPVSNDGLIERNLITKGKQGG